MFIKSSRDNKKKDNPNKEEFLRFFLFIYFLKVVNIGYVITLSELK